MIRVAYNQQKQPPAPFVLVTLANPFDGTAMPDVPAQLDTAADRTLVPLALMEALGLEPIDDILIGGVGGNEESLAATRRGARTRVHALKSPQIPNGASAISRRPLSSGDFQANNGPPQNHAAKSAASND